jgi:hypothetical protein
VCVCVCVCWGGGRFRLSVAIKVSIGRNHFGDVGEGWGIILEWILKFKVLQRNRMNLTEDREQWWALVNTVTNFWVL